MPRTGITINQSLEKVWSFLTNKDKWQGWWGGAIKQVSPGWQDGATITWANGNTTKVSAFSPKKRLQISSTFMQHTFNLSKLGSNSTKLDVEFSAQGGASFSDGGSAHMQTLNANLNQFKRQIESGK